MTLGVNHTIPRIVNAVLSTNFCEVTIYYRIKVSILSAMIIVTN